MPLPREEDRKRKASIIKITFDFLLLFWEGILMPKDEIFQGNRYSC